MMRSILVAIFSTLLLSSCIPFRSQAPDSEVDTQLGVEADEEAVNAQDALSDLREEKLKEQQRSLERHITDTGYNPSVNE
ncbi:MAG: hypothetical protein HYZ85_01695 [Candidatus Omnitrophica bacterium]|nr:hypothetical protein [Candidatus Omnitrophota bacterium]